jgi:hypothetical protein
MYLEIQAQVSAKPFRWHNTLVLMKLDLIHKMGHDNMVQDAHPNNEQYPVSEVEDESWE